MSGMFDDPLFAGGADNVLLDDLPDEPPDVDDHHIGDWSPPNANGQHPDDGTDEQADAGDTRDWRERGIEVELDKLRIRQEARRRLDDENRPPITLPLIKSLDALLAEPDPPTCYRIGDVAPTGSHNMLSAQYKAGKTTLRDNLVRSLVDGEAFLGRFEVYTPSRQVVIVDNELSESMLRRWLSNQGVQNTAAVSVVSLRGRVSSFNLLDDRCRGQWATRLRDVGADYLILDCLRPALDALGLDENRDAGRFLVAFDALLDEAGIADSLTVHHMGHANERARGDSRLQDWPDAIWRLVRENDEPDSPRYFAAFGRDVSVPEGRLSFNPTTRRLTYAEGSRVDARTESAVLAVIYILAEDAKTGGPGMSGRAIETEVIDAGHPREVARNAIRHAVKQGSVAVETGARRAKVHRIANPCAQCGLPVTGDGRQHQSCPSRDEQGALE